LLPVARSPERGLAVRRAEQICAIPILAPQCWERHFAAETRESAQDARHAVAPRERSVRSVRPKKARRERSAERKDPGGATGLG
jgi:hypothetical protein